MIRLLIADDECLEREALTEMVSRRFEHEVVLETAENGRKAADTAILWGADLILMDIEMPGMSGLDAARAVLAQRPGCRVIFVTAYSLFQYAHEAVHLGACDYLLKPVDPDELEASVRRAMRQIETERKLEELAAALDTTPAWLLGIETAAAPPPGFEPLPEMVRVPLVGSIACGTPITAEQNIESYIGVPAAWHADFALTCHGSSMAPTICDGDIVCIRRQPEVEQGEIAAVRIGDEATLKHFHRQGSTVMLLADNAAVCPPMIYAGSQLEEIQIEGRAVGFCRGL